METEGRDERIVSLKRGFLYDAHAIIGELH